MVLIDAYPTNDPDRVVVEAAAETLLAGGHAVERVGLVEQGFDPFMSEAERAAYHSDQPLLSDETRKAAALIDGADALLFCYPTTTFTVPALLKGWLERVLVLGVAFVFDDKGRVAPGMTQIRRLGVVTTTPHGWLATRRQGDLGRRTIMWTLRLNCHRRCRRTFVSVPRGGVGRRMARVERALARW